MRAKKVIIGMLVIGLVGMIPGYRQVADRVSKAIKAKPSLTMVIDPGHGGIDGGAVASDGTSEKNINMDIALAVKKEAEKYGVKVVMTREIDEGLYENKEMGGKWTKLGDLKARKRIIDEIAPDVTLSLHLNSFKADSSVRGAQVFYPKNNDEQAFEKNKNLAEKVQSTLNYKVSEGKERVALEKNDTYLFKNIKSQIILIECGFLSNEGDRNNLKLTKFQQKIAVYIMKAVAEFYTLNIQKNVPTNIVDSRTNSL